MSSPEITKSMRDAQKYAISVKELIGEYECSYRGFIAGQLAAMASWEGERERLKAELANAKDTVHRVCREAAVITNPVAFCYSCLNALHPPDERG